MEFVRQAEAAAAGIRGPHAYLAEQLRRAATSVCLNIAEGAGEFSPREKARFYRIARRSGTECAAILDLCSVLELVQSSQLDACAQLLDRILAMLTRLTRRRDKA